MIRPPSGLALLQSMDWTAQVRGGTCDSPGAPRGSKYSVYTPPLYAYTLTHVPEPYQETHPHTPAGRQLCSPHHLPPGCILPLPPPPSPSTLSSLDPPFASARTVPILGSKDAGPGSHEDGTPYLPGSTLSHPRHEGGRSSWDGRSLVQRTAWRVRLRR